METQMMQEYNKGPRELASVPNYKLFTYQEAMDVQAKNHWGVLAFVLAVAGGVSGYLLRGLYLGIFDYNAFARDYADLSESDDFINNKTQTMSFTQRLRLTYRNDFHDDDIPRYECGNINR